jgi:hypothetical protein
MSFDNLSSLALMRTSESFSDLNAELSGGNSQPRIRGPTASRTSAASSSTGSATSVEDAKPFGLGKNIMQDYLKSAFF